MRRNKILVGAACAAALSAGCRRAAPPVETGVSSGVTLSAPTPSSATLASPLGAGASDYTNEMQAQNLRTEAAQLGIRKLSQPGAHEDETEEDSPPVTYDEGLEKTRVMTRDLAAQRHAIDKGKDKTVALPHETPGLLPGRKEDGGPIEPAPEADRPKDPATK